MTAERKNEIGRARCPVCRSDRAHLRVSAKELAYTTCNACNSQCFARSEISDTHLRGALIGGKAVPPVEVEPQRVEPLPTTAAVVVQKPAAKAPAAGLGWGVYA